MTGQNGVIRGLVIPSRWDEDGRVTAVVIAANDEVEYQVDDGSADLMNYLHQLVEVSGTVEMQSGRPVIKIVGIRRLN